MSKLRNSCCLTLLIGCLWPTPICAQVVTSTIVISEVYGGGGSASNSSFNQDFVELYNNGTTTVNLSGWSLQVAENATGNFTNIISLSGSLNPGQFGYVLAAIGSNNTRPSLPTGLIQLAQTSVNIGTSNGKIALANTSTAVNSTAGAVTPGTGVFTNVVDFLGYGTGNQYEGLSALSSLSSTTSAIRIATTNNLALQDTNVNTVDFITGAPTPGFVPVVPEPGSLMLVGATCASALLWRRYKLQCLRKVHSP